MASHPLLKGAIIASWSNEERTETWQLLADGTLTHLSKQHAADVWSPSRPVGQLRNSIQSFQDYLDNLTSA